MTPFEVAFLESKINFLFFLNRMVDLGFIIDMVIAFHVAYFDNKTNELKKHRGLIAIRYPPLPRRDG